MSAPISRRRDAQIVAERLRNLFPGPYRSKRLCTAFERGVTSMEEIMAGKNVPRDIVLIVGLLAACPIEDWPPRWQAARTHVPEKKV